MTWILNPKPPGSGADSSIGVDEDGSVTIHGDKLESITDKTPPDPITDFRVQAQSNGTVKLSWNPTKDNDNGSGLAGYKIYRSESVTGVVSEADIKNNLIRIEPAIGKLNKDKDYIIVVLLEDKVRRVLTVAPTENEGWFKQKIGNITEDFVGKEYSFRLDPYSHMSLGAGDTEAKDTATVPGSLYYYGISAFDRNNNENSIVWSLIPILSQNVIPPKTPHNLAGKALKGEIRLAWEAPANAGSITYYEIWKRSGLSDAHEWEVLGRSGTLSYIEAIGKVEASEIKGWRYKVRAYNLHETYGQFDAENGSPVDVSGYGTYIKRPLPHN